MYTREACQCLGTLVSSTNLMPEAEDLGAAHGLEAGGTS